MRLLKQICENFHKLLMPTIFLFASGCDRKSDEVEGVYLGEIQDWKKLVFSGHVELSRLEIPLELVLTQNSQTEIGGEALFSKKQGAVTTTWKGVWSVEKGKRRIFFEAENQVFYLTKKGASQSGKGSSRGSTGTWYELQTDQDSFFNSDGSPVLLLFQEPRSESHILEVTLNFKDEKVVFREAGDNRQKGDWESNGGELVARFENEDEREVEKMFFSWDDGDLLLRRIVVIRKGKVMEDFGVPSQKGRISHLEYQGDNRPRFKRR
ncbi:MAG: hypothetical protein CMI30_01995 [Opitutae bacterium]|nr:hypothetical protein [Opitutae bacterium]|tara:strand:- start:622 stop:1419 length:798 start_codon:yes stop_codon:yes gene_type:complete